MKFHTLLLSLSLAGTGAMVARAQLIIGSANPRVQPGFQLIANQYKGPDDRVAKLFAQPVEGTILYKVTNGAFTTNKFSGGFWSNPSETLEPGEGAVVFNPSTNSFRGSFSGEILQGNLINRIPSGLSIKSSMLPQAGAVSTELGLRLSPFDNVYRWRTNHFEVFTFLPTGGWHPSEPTIGMGEAFFIRASKELTWNRTFSVNQ